MPRVPLDSLDLAAAERALCIEALCRTGSVTEAAQLLGCSRNQLRRKIVRHKIEWPRPSKEAA